MNASRENSKNLQCLHISSHSGLCESRSYLRTFWHSSTRKRATSHSPSGTVDFKMSCRDFHELTFLKLKREKFAFTQIKKDLDVQCGHNKPFTMYFFTLIYHITLLKRNRGSCH